MEYLRNHEHEDAERESHPSQAGGDRARPQRCRSIPADLPTGGSAGGRGLPYSIHARIHHLLLSYLLGIILGYGTSIRGRSRAAKGRCFDVIGRFSVYHSGAIIRSPPTHPVGKVDTGRERSLGRTCQRGKHGGGPPVFTFEAAPGAPLVSALRFGRDLASSGGLPGAHAHDYLALAYFERDGGSLRSGERSWELRAGDAFVSSPGAVHDPSGLAQAEGWAVFFPVEVLAPLAPAPSSPGAPTQCFSPSWRAWTNPERARGGRSYPLRSAPLGQRASPPSIRNSVSVRTATGRRRWLT
jgi:hypothetical protein